MLCIICLNRACAAVCCELPRCTVGMLCISYANHACAAVCSDLPADAQWGCCVSIYVNRAYAAVCWELPADAQLGCSVSSAILIWTCAAVCCESSSLGHTSCVRSFVTCDCINTGTNSRVPHTPCTACAHPMHSPHAPCPVCAHPMHSPRTPHAQPKHSPSTNS